MRFDVLTLFPEIIETYLTSSILGRAREQGRFSAQTWNIREFATDKHRTVDDTPYGGGAGMVMKVEPIDRALAAVRQALQPTQPSPEASAGKATYNLKPKTVVLSARGKQFTQAKAQEYAQLDQLVLICGRYEGIDQRVADYLADEELSLGPYVLAGGEIAALAVIEATARLLPGVLGNPESLTEESFTLNSKFEYRNSKQIRNSNDKTFKPVSDFGFRASDLTTEYPQYTKPEEYKEWKVPDILLSGNHQQIKKWREEQTRRKTT